MSATEQPRIPAGAPKSAGGQWAATARREVGIDLSGDREAAITAGEHVPAVFTTGDRSPTVDGWWDTQASLAEWAGEGAAFPKMPGDWTPRRTGGTADTGLRRTHRMTYRGNGFSLHMPSATSIRSFSAANRGAFDIPVEATDEHGRSITAWVRAVQHGPGHWSVSGLGFGGVTDAKVSEAVASVLESRRPTATLRRSGDLIEKHRQRIADPGREPGAGPFRVDRGCRLLRRRPDRHDADPGTHQCRRGPRPRQDVRLPGAPRGVRGAADRRSARCGVQPARQRQTRPDGEQRRTYAASRTHDCPAKIGAKTRPVRGLDETQGRAAAVRGLRRRRGRGPLDGLTRDQSTDNEF